MIFISASFTRAFFSCNITGPHYVEMLLLNMIKLLFLFFHSDCNVQCCFLQSLEALIARNFILKDISIVCSSYSQVSGSYLPFSLSGTQIKYGGLEVGNNTQ